MHHGIKRIIAAGLVTAASSVLADDLESVYRLAQQSDPQLRAAEAGHQAALEVRPQSRAALLPNLSLSANITQNDTTIESGYGSDADYTSNGYALNLKQPIYHHDYYVQLKQADAQIARADAQYEASRQGLILRVSEAYFNVLSANDNLQFAEAEIRFLTQQLHQTKQRFEVGLTAITDVHEAQAGYDAAIANEIVARNALDNAREALREITGMAHQDLAPLVEQIPLVTPEPADINQWVDTALQNNLSLLAADAAARAAEQEYKRRQAGHYPTLDLVASHAYSDSTDNPNFGSERVDNTVGVQLSVPIYAGGSTSSQAREAQHLYRQAQETLDQQRRATIRSTREAYLGVTAGISRVNASKQALASAETALEATQAGFEVGTRTAVDVLNAQRDRFSAQRDYARARYDYILATLNLKQASGGLTEVDIAEVNRWLK